MVKIPRIFFFGQKLAAAFAAFISALGHDICGYIPNIAQEPDTLTGIGWLMTFFAVIYIVIGITLVSFYPIDGRLHKQITADMQSRVKNE